MKYFNPGVALGGFILGTLGNLINIPICTVTEWWLIELGLVVLSIACGFFAGWLDNKLFNNN